MPDQIENSLSEKAAAKCAKRMAKFLAKPPKRITEEAVERRRSKNIRRTQPKGWLDELCDLQSWHCAYCRQNMRRAKKGRIELRTATLDHVLPISRGGRNQRSNLVAACSACNSAKGSMTGEEFRAMMSFPANLARGPAAA